MRARHALFLAALVAASAALSAEGGIRIAVMDFALESDNPQFKNLGKGFTELTSVEVARLPGFVLVDRERRNALLEEQAFSLSGAADEAGSVAIGKLLSADYLVTGTILDLFGNLVVTYSVVKTDTGEIIGKRSAEGKPEEYKRIVREIGVGVAEMTGRKAVVAAAPPPPPPAAKQAEVLTSFSAAVEALDKKDVKAAAKALEAAKKIDPKDAAVNFYLDKLTAGSSKFAIIPPSFYALDNPATIGSRKEDQFVFGGALGGTLLTGQEWNDWEYSAVPLDGTYGGSSLYPGSYAVRELDSPTILGYSIPLARGLGLGVQAFFSHLEKNLVPDKDNPGEGSAWDSVNIYGGVLSLGWSPLPWLSLGLGLTGGQFGDASGSTGEKELLYGGELGLVLRNRSGSLLFSLVGGTASYKMYFFDMDTIDVGAETSWPLYADASLTLGFNQMRDFAVAKVVMNSFGKGFNIPAPFFQLIPAYEHWFGKGLSVRAGGVVTLSPDDDAVHLGYGGSAGLTALLGSWEIDLSGTYRMRPSNCYSGAIIPETVFTFAVRRNALVVKGPK